MQRRKVVAFRMLAASEIVFQDAREALQAIGFIPLVRIRHAEHWVRGERHVVLTTKGLVDEVKSSEVCLSRASHCWFSEDDEGVLTAHV